MKLFKNFVKSDNILFIGFVIGLLSPIFIYGDARLKILSCLIATVVVAIGNWDLGIGGRILGIITLAGLVPMVMLKVATIFSKIDGTIASVYLAIVYILLSLSVFSAMCFIPKTIILILEKLNTKV